MSVHEQKALQEAELGDGNIARHDSLMSNTRVVRT
jgi:hypothetical protein